MSAYHLKLTPDEKEMQAKLDAVMNRAAQSERELRQGIPLKTLLLLLSPCLVTLALMPLLVR